jgi:hypothetical protein
MAERSPKTGWVIGAFAAITVALGLWLAMGSEGDLPDGQGEAVAGHTVDSSASAVDPAAASSKPAAPAPATQDSREDEGVAAEAAAPPEPPRIAQTAGDRPVAVPVPAPAKLDDAPVDDPPGDDSPGDSRAVSVRRIAEGGRLSIDPDSLPEGELLALELAMPDEARGTESLAVKITSVDGRQIEAIGLPAAGSGTGLRFEIDPTWLKPGRYLIEVRTAEKIHLPLRRYVLEVP